MTTSPRCLLLALLAVLAGACGGGEDGSKGGAPATDAGTDGSATAGNGGGASTGGGAGAPGTGGLGTGGAPQGGAGGDVATGGSGPEGGPAVGNACGGPIPLGGTDAPGDACGPCGDGVSACSKVDALVCLGASETNACGGCGPLRGTPATPCGACNDGTWACVTDVLKCEGASPGNACGGCTTLAGDPGDLCAVTAGGTGSLGCVDGDTLSCIPDGANACGGAAVLAASPGDPCGTCDAGHWICDGADALRCEGDQNGVNACGGCGPLEAAPGTTCGGCSATFQCVSGAGHVACIDSTRNACGGCTALTGTPGEGCAGGVLACSGQDELACTAGATNACGGTATLDGTLGDACGACDEGFLTCVTTDSLGCAGGLAANACGGCGILLGTPGDPCAPRHVWTCATDGSLGCDPAAVESVEVQPATAALFVGDTMAFDVEVTLEEGTKDPRTSGITWTSSNPGVATVDTDGVVTAVSAGSTTLSATVEGVTGQATVTVSVPALTTITLSPDGPTLSGLGATAQLTATGTYSDGSQANVTGQATWSSLSTGIATVASGLVTAAGAGGTTITASLSGVSGSTSVTVTVARLVSLAVSPVSPSVALGLTQAFTVQGTYDDASTADLTGQVAWGTGSSAIATIDTAGLATSRGQGNTAITATLGLVTGQATLTVGPRALASIAITPDPAPSVAAGRALALTATGTFTDGTQQNISGQVTWNTGTPATATVGGTGIVQAVAAGTTIITATSGSLSDQVTVTVLPPVVDSVAYEIAGPVTIGVGTTLAVDLLASYSDGTVVIVTASASYVSSAPGTVSVDPGVGTLLAVAAGSATVTGTFAGRSDTLVVDAVEAPQIRTWGVDPSAMSTPPQIRTRGLDPSVMSMPTQIRTRGLAPHTMAKCRANGTGCSAANQCCSLICNTGSCGN